MLTLDGRILQHKRTFLKDSQTLNTLLDKVKTKLRTQSTQSLDPHWWTDVTELTTKRYRAIHQI